MGIHPSIHPSIDLFLVALIRVYLPSIFQKSFQNPSKTFAKSFQNHAKFLPKPFQNPSKTHLQKQTCPKRISKSIFLASWSIFIDFFGGPWAPRASQNGT